MTRREKTDAQLIREISRRVMQTLPGDFYRRGQRLGGKVATAWPEKGQGKKGKRTKAA